MIRIIADIFALLAIFVLPSYISIIFLIILVFYFDIYIESVFVAYLVDVLYGGRIIFGIHFNYIFAFAIFIIFLLSFRLKEILRFYPRS